MVKPIGLFIQFFLSVELNPRVPEMTFIIIIVVVIVIITI